MKTEWTGEEVATQKHIGKWCNDMIKLRDCLELSVNPSRDIDTSHLDHAIAELTAMSRKIEEGVPAIVSLSDIPEELLEDCEGFPSFQ